jgi:hypothetical protein
MKKLALLFAAMLMSTTFFAQDHFSFRGVSLDGNLEEFISLMAKEGFKVDKKTDNIATMTGEFTKKNVTLQILSTPQTNTVWKVSVIFEEGVTWSSLKSSYLEYQELFSRKYGKPQSHVETFAEPFREGDGNELQALRNRKCNYSTIYELKTGTINIELDKAEVLKISYEDSFNAQLKDAEKVSSILDEI